MFNLGWAFISIITVVVSAVLVKKGVCWAKLTSHPCRFHSQGVQVLSGARGPRNTCEMTWLELGTSHLTAFYHGGTADVAGMKGSQRPQGLCFLQRVHISLNSLVEIGPPDGILCISPDTWSCACGPSSLELPLSCGEESIFDLLFLSCLHLNTYFNKDLEGRYRSVLKS